MSSSELRDLTASDELTLDEEFANQQSWREDPSKLTFISADATTWNAKRDSGAATFAKDRSQEEVWGVVDDDSTVMRGDVNMFFHEDEEDEEGILGEINIMVAEPITRGKGFGKRMLFMFLWYVLTYRMSLMEEYHGAGDGKGPSFSGFVAKVDKDNLVSIKMFESVGFWRVREEANYFGEVDLRLDVGLAGEKVEQYFKGDEVKLLQYRLNAVG
jgi:RimJ/RimL family protein N-acetyltransferase